MNPIDPRRSERHLLAAVHRWARTNSYRRGRHGWQNGPDATATVLVTWRSDPYPLRLSWAAGRFDDGSPCWSIGSDLRVESVTQAVDVLVALDILPAWLSSAYGLAEDRYREQIETLQAEVERLRREDCETCHDTGWAVEGEEFDGTPVRTPCTCGIGHDVRIGLGWVEAISR